MNKGRKQWLGATEHQASVGASSLLTADPFAIAATQDTIQPTVLPTPQRETPTQDAVTVSPTIAASPTPPDDIGCPTHMDAEFSARQSPFPSHPATQAACEETQHQDLSCQQHDQQCSQPIESIDASSPPQPVTTTARLGPHSHRAADRPVLAASELTALGTAAAERNQTDLPSRRSPAAEGVADEAMPHDAMPHDAPSPMQICEPQRKQSPVRTLADPLAPPPDFLQSQPTMLEVGLSPDGRYTTSSLRWLLPSPHVRSHCVGLPPAW